jgi:uncharacterized phiE125 gp8 family phage protein
MTIPDPQIITAPILPGVFLAEVKQHLRVENTSEDALIDTYINAATRQFERLTGRTIYETELQIVMDDFPACPVLELPRACPLISVTHIKYRDKDAVQTTWDSSGYVLDTYRGRVAPAYGETWPSFDPYPIGAVEIRYKAGIASASPQTFAEDGMLHCIREMVGTMYEHRESQIASERMLASFAENPATKALVEMYRVNYEF